MAAKVIATWAGMDNLETRIAGFNQQVFKNVVGQALFIEDEMTAYAKKNAPWTDRTGNARAGLHTVHNVGQNFVELTVAHSVPYGIWLEVRWSGKYAIIGPTIFWGGKLLISRIDSMLKRMGTP
jgi:hypothetical protein